MDRMTQYRKIVEGIIHQHVEQEKKESNSELLAVCDAESGNYLLMEVGWEPSQRIYNTLFHLRLKDNQVWIEEDWSEQGIARELLDAGVPSNAIELGFQPPDLRPYVEWPSKQEMIHSPQ